MLTLNALYPTDDQVKAALGRDDGRPICMLNLLKFREQASYEDGRETALTGAQAYALYGRAMTRLVTEAGGQLLFAGEARGLLIGTVEAPWDQVAVMMYPSFAAMVAITTSAAYAEIQVHRDAGLAGQLLIETVRP